LGGLCSVIGKNASVDIRLNPTETFPEIRFKKTYGIAFSGDKETQRKISLNNILKGFAKDFIFEITLNGVNDTESIITEQDYIVEKLITATLTSYNLNEKEFRNINDLEMKIFNESSEEKIEEDIEVKKNLVRTKGAEVIEQAQYHCERGSYRSANSCLSNMEDMCEDFEDDEVIKGMKENITKQKEMVNNERYGRRNSMNMKAFAKNMNNCYMMQESSPTHCKQAFTNKSKQMRSNM